MAAAITTTAAGAGATFKLAALVLIPLAAAVGCEGFAPSSGRIRRRGCQRPAPSSPHIAKHIIAPSSSLCGISSVDDYFASFESGDDDCGSRGGVGGVNDYFATLGATSSRRRDDDRPRDNSGSPPKKWGRQKKYFGHGRIGGDGNEGGVFDINNYFSSFERTGSSGSEEDEAYREAADFLNFCIASPFQPPLVREDEYDDPSQSSGGGGMTHEEVVAHNNARLCPKLLLTQCALQSFIYVLEECRDPHSGKWIEDFLGLQNLGNYHGTGALNVTRYPTWDSVLYDMMQQPNEKMIVSAKRRGRGHGGWSKNNPYLQERWVEFRIDIRPATLVQRLLPVREQLAREFESDLDIVRAVDETIMSSYFSRLRGYGAAAANPSGAAFDRISVGMLSNFTQTEGGSSPYRRGNFDLLYSLCTQASAHRLLRGLQEQASSSSSSPEDGVAYRWFRKFYAERAPEHFDGDQAFGRADDFVDALLSTPPSLVEASDGSGSVGLTDPLRMAESIIGIRSDVAREWKALMGEVRADHSRLNDVLFRVMTGRTFDESGNDAVEIQEETTMEALSDSAGAFE